MSRIDAAKMNRVHGRLEVGPGALIDSDILALARNYKRNVATRFKLLAEGDIKHIQARGLFASVKLDGQLHFLYRDAEECFLFNANGRVVTGLALLDEAERALAGLDSVVLIGELYYRAEGERSRVYKVTAALGSEAEYKADGLAFAAFDLLLLNGEHCARNGFERNQELLAEHVPESGAIHRVAQEPVDPKALTLKFRDWVREAGEEGVVAVAPETHVIYKIKPRHDVRAVVVGYTERPDEPGAVRVLLVALMRPDGSLQVLSRVGTGFDDEQRRALFDRLAPSVVPSQYKETDGNHILFTMVRPELVIEMAFHDLIMESGTGKPQIKAVLTYSAETGYEALLPEPFVALLGPVFKRTLDDTTPSPEELALTQLAEYVDLGNLRTPARHLELADSRILRREVFKKTMKGLTSVRKFISWKTNKEDLDADFPPYVFCFVDYSPGRQDPLKRVVRIAHSEEAIDSVFERYKAEEVKRGWAAA